MFCQEFLSKRAREQESFKDWYYAELQEVRNVPDVGSALKEGRQNRAPSKLRRARTSYGVLNEFLESDRKVFQIEVYSLSYYFGYIV